MCTDEDNESSEDKSHFRSEIDANLIRLRADEFCCVVKHISGEITGVLTIPKQGTDDTQEDEFHVNDEMLFGRSWFGK